MGRRRRCLQAVDNQGNAAARPETPDQAAELRDDLLDVRFDLAIGTGRRNLARARGQIACLHRQEDRLRIIGIEPEEGSTISCV